MELSSCGVPGERRSGFFSWKRKALAIAGALLTMGSAALFGASAATADTSVQVIVWTTGSENIVGDVASVGGTVIQQFSIINGVEATVLSSEVAVLSAMPGVNVTPDISVNVQSTTPSTGPHTPSDAFLAQTGATQLAQAGDTGRGVTVAVVDTGISNLPDFAGRLVGGVDLSGEKNAFQDSYGHGTFVAGLIAGNGASSNGQYSGEAPGANLVSIKVAGADGTTKLGTLISGLQWAVNNEGTYNIKVLNISLGFQPDRSTVNNPLDLAVERAWGSGLAIVVSAGNSGPFNGTITSPGDDPLVITVGALDDLAQATVANDEMNNFSSVGPTSPDGWVKPDLVTSGRSIVSLAAPGSTIYNNYPSARIGSGNFVGSGTSFSAAITSGAAALVLANNPSYSPNQIKADLLGGAGPGPIGNPFVDGHGALNAYAASIAPSSVNFNQSTTGETSTSNGTTVPLWNGNSWNGNSWNGNSWNGNSWNGNSWNGAAFNGNSWNGNSWNGNSWNGNSWNGNSWNGFTFNGNSWNGNSWNGAAFNGNSWNGNSWNGNSWNGNSWNGAAWNGNSWNGNSWN
ncbi:MAG TPA: S8 family serine peptidase [Acidimicrobiales bacterium]